MTCTLRHAVVTGSSSGIGRATALRMAAAGWHVYAGVRKHDDAPRGQMITPLIMDVTDTEQIGMAVESVGGHVGRAGLNALVDNAGIGVAMPMELVALESLRWQLEVNVVGQVAVTQAFLPMLRQARGRVVIIGSIGDRFTPPFGGPLAASKAAIASIADAFRQELAPWDVGVVLLEPASIHTDAIDKLQRHRHLLGIVSRVAFDEIACVQIARRCSRVRRRSGVAACMARRYHRGGANTST